MKKIGFLTVTLVSRCPPQKEIYSLENKLKIMLQLRTREDKEFRKHGLSWPK